MEPSELLHFLAATLERLEVPYYVTGSMATTTYGEPRFTNDIDVVVDLRLDQVDAFCAAFAAPEFYCSRDAAVQAIQQRFQFKVLHPSSGLKIDVIVTSDSEFDRLRLHRAVRIPEGEQTAIRFSSPEDVIVKKLEFYQLGDRKNTSGTFWMC